MTLTAVHWETFARARFDASYLAGVLGVPLADAEVALADAEQRLASRRARVAEAVHALADT